MRSDSTFLEEEGEKSKVSVHYFLSDFIKDTAKSQPKLKRFSHKPYKMTKRIISSDAECEGALAFCYGQDVSAMRSALTEMYNPQPPIPIQVRNTTVISFINGLLKENIPKMQT